MRINKTIIMRIIWERTIHIALILLCHDRRSGSIDAILWLWRLLRTSEYPKNSRERKTAQTHNHTCSWWCLKTSNFLLWEIINSSSCLNLMSQTFLLIAAKCILTNTNMLKFTNEVLGTLRVEEICQMSDN